MVSCNSESRGEKWQKSDFSDRLKLALKNESVNSFASRCDMSEGSLRKYLAGTTPGLDKAVRIAAAAGVSLEWLATGKGSQEIDGVDNDKDQLVEIPRYNLAAAAGAGAVVDREQPSGFLAFRRDWIHNSLHASPNKLAVIEVRGDSMEPTIRDGDLLLIDCAFNQFVEDAIYVLGQDGELVVKRLQRLLNKSLIVKSDNPAYRQEELAPEDQLQLRIVARVRWIARMI